MSGDRTLPTIAYILLAHEKPSEVVRAVRLLREADPSSVVVLHYDRKCANEALEQIAGCFGDDARVVLLRNRVSSGWGQFGLVEAAMLGVEALEHQDFYPDFIHLASASCMPIKPLKAFRRYLADHIGEDFIESYSSDWIVGGLREGRYTYRHYFEERRQRGLFYLSYLLQRSFGLKRRPPKGISPRFGSQWWTLSYSTAAEVVRRVRQSSDLKHFFRTCWVPDELMFQTMVPIVSSVRHNNFNLTFYGFTDQGKPMVFYDDHIADITHIPYFFARKISKHAAKLRAHLAGVAKSDEAVYDFSRIGGDIGLYSCRYQTQLDMKRPGQLFFKDQTLKDLDNIVDALRQDFVAVRVPERLISAPWETILEGFTVKRFPGQESEDLLGSTPHLALELPAHWLVHELRSEQAVCVVFFPIDVSVEFWSALRSLPQISCFTVLPEGSGLNSVTGSTGICGTKLPRNTTDTVLDKRFKKSRFRSSSYHVGRDIWRAASDSQRLKSEVLSSDDPVHVVVSEQRDGGACLGNGLGFLEAVVVDR